MNNGNFIQHNDPTVPIDLSSVTLEQQYAKLTDQEKLLVAAKVLGMNHIPVDMKTFLFDDYFLGNDQITNHGKSIFKFWQDKFEEIFPTPVTTKTPYISFGGAIGTGKSFTSKMIGLYMYHRLDCCTNAFTSLGLAGGTKLAYGFFHANYDTAYKDFVQFFKFVFETSPYFKSLYNKPQIRLIASGPQSTGAVLGSQLIFCVLSELGFWKPSDAKAKMDEVLGRFESRFKNKRFFFGNVIADSSAKDADNSATTRFETIVPPDELFRISPSQWQVRPELYAESNGQTFRFYRGDTIQGPRIIEDGEDITLDTSIDPDRIIDIPISAKYRFISDPVRNLRDLAGYAYSGNELFFNNNLSHLINCSKLINYAPEEITVDFYDKTDSIYPKVESMLHRVPKQTNLFLAYDLGLKTDKTGVALCYYDGEIKVGNSSLPKFKFPLIFVVSRKPGQATSLDHLYQFIKDLISHGYLITFSADSFASAGLFQSCERDGIDYKSISADKNMDAYNMFKNVVNTERCEMPYVNILLRECSELKLTFNGKNNQHAKIDHPEVSSCTEFDYKDAQGDMPGTKDCADAVVCALWSCYQKYAEYNELGFGGGFSMTMNSLNRITGDPKEEVTKKIQNMLQGIF